MILKNPVWEKRLKIPLSARGVIFETDLGIFAKDKNKAHRLDRYRPKGKERSMFPVIFECPWGQAALGNKEKITSIFVRTT